MEKTNKALGKWGEKVAKAYLVSQGHEIREINWRFGRAEADIITFLPIDQILVFVEVKARKHNTFGEPEDFVTDKKQRLLYELATEYMYRQGYEGEIRFDIVSIVGEEEKGHSLRHYADAFFPSW